MLDRRGDARVTVDATASILLNIEGAEREMVALSPRDISPAGAFLPHHNPPPVGIRGEMEIVVHSEVVQLLTGASQLAVQMSIEIIRCEHDGFAIRFDQRSHRVALAA